MAEITPKIEKSWLLRLHNEFEADYFKKLKDFLTEERAQKFTLYPKGAHIFEAFNQTPFDAVKVVIIGQDPYHGPNQAHGLSFSVPDGVKLPPSLRNIYKELNADLGLPIPHTGNLTPWTKEGVLLLNATLTVRAQTPGSHQNKGWETFTDAAIKALSDERENLVFILWGSYAQQKGTIIDTQKHLVIRSAHPSPFAAHRGFFGSKPFSKTNAYLTQKGIKPVEWSLPA